ncbi:unnamed protein product [Closterium sp. NIES-65]|nr:unnamed protein product [Closterium sp. NIES-65]
MCLWRTLPTNPPLNHPPPLLSPSNSPSARFPPPLFSPHLLQLVTDCVLKLLLLHTFPPPQYPPLNCSTANSFTTIPPLISPLSSTAADYPATIPPLVSPLSGAAADYSATIPPPLVSPLSGAAADYSATIPPPLVSPLSGVAADYFATIPPPLVSPFSGAAADYSATIPPPLVSPLSGAAADYSATIPPPLVSPLNGAAADYSATIPPPLVSPLSSAAADSFALIPLPLISLPSSALQLAVNFPSWLNCLERTLSGTLVSGFNLWFFTQQSGSGAIPKPASAPTSISSDPYADGLRAAIAETERIAATAQATATAAPDNAAARHLTRVLAESLESTRKRLTEHLTAPSPRSASTPSAFAPSHSDLLADWHVANARACQVILACLPPTLLPQCSHIRYAKDLLGYLIELFQSQTPISVIALLRELTSLRLADFTTMADYIARVQTLSSQLASQKFELSDHVCSALLLTGLTPEYSVHVTLYGERPTDQWSFSRVSAFLLQAELNLRSCPPTAAAVTPSSAPPPLSPPPLSPLLPLALATPSLLAPTSFAKGPARYLRPTVAALSLPHTLEFVLDSGAIDSVFRDAGVLRSFPQPLSIQGAGDTMTMTCTATSSLPCPASPSGAVTGLYVPSCCHNLLSLCSSTSLCASYLS